MLVRAPVTKNKFRGSLEVCYNETPLYKKQHTLFFYKYRKQHTLFFIRIENSRCNMKGRRDVRPWMQRRDYPSKQV